MWIKFCSPTEGCPSDISRLLFLMEDYDGHCWFTEYEGGKRLFRGIAIDRSLSFFKMLLTIVHELGHLALHLFLPRLYWKSFVKLHDRYDKIMDYLNI
jgi:hypothetical protein